MVTSWAAPLLLLGASGAPPTADLSLPGAGYTGTLQVDLYSAAGVKLNVPPITAILKWKYQGGEKMIGAFSFEVPAADAAAVNLATGLQVRIIVKGEGQVFAGYIQQINTDLSNRTIEVSGPDLAIQFVRENTYRTFWDSDTLATVAAAYVAGTDFSTGSLDVPATTLYGPHYWITRWQGLGAAADQFGLLLRTDLQNIEIDVGVFGTNPTGLRFQSFDEIPTDLDNYIVPLIDLKLDVVDTEVINEIIPLGQTEGIGGELLTLENSTRSSPYTIQNAANQDGSTRYYIADAASVATYGKRVKPAPMKSILSDGAAAADLVAAANALYDLGATLLDRRKDALRMYSATPVGLKHLIGGVPTFQVGDLINVVGRASVTLEDARRLWLNVDEDLYVMAYERAGDASGRDVWRFTLNNVPRQILDDGNQTAQMIEKIFALETAPVPFVLFGGGRMLLSPDGIEFHVDATSPTPTGAELTIQWLRDTVAQHVEIRGAVQETGDNLAYLDVIAYGTSGDEGGRVSVQAGNDADSNRAFLVGSDTAGAIRAGLGAFGNGEVRFDGFPTLYRGTSPAALTIASGVISISLGMHTVDTESAAASDDLATINAASGYSLQNGQLLILTPENTARTTVLIEGGNIALDGGDLALDTTDKAIMLVYDGTNWKPAIPLAGGGMQPIVKAADEVVNNSATLQADDDLLFAVAANKSYQFEGVIYVTTGATPDFKLQFTGPTGAVGSWNSVIYESAGSFDLTDEALGSPRTIAGALGRTPVYVFGAIANGANAGNLALDWAQGTADATDTTVHAGSYIKRQQQ